MLGLFYNGQCLFDLALGCLVALGLGLDDVLHRMVHIQLVAEEFGALHLQCLCDRFLFAKLNHGVLLAAFLCEPCAFHFAGMLAKVLDNFQELPVRRYVDDDHRASDLFDSARLKGDGQRRIFGQLELLQLRIRREDHLLQNSVKFGKKRCIDQAQTSVIPMKAASAITWFGYAPSTRFCTSGGN